MNLQQKIQVALGGLLIIGGVGLCFVNPVVGGISINAGLAVAGFSNTVTSAMKNALVKPTTDAQPAPVKP